MRNFLEMGRKIKEAVGYDLDEGTPPVLHVSMANLVRTLTILHSQTDLRFCHLVDIAVVDYPERDPRFEVNYVVRSICNNGEIIVRTYVDEDEPLDSVAPVYKSANWRERDASEMFGILIRNHNSSRKLKTSTENFPLRKDFS
jgi:NADH:ubiquinone oxidoreductase subunit C